MKKQLVIIGIIVLLVCVGLSGCNQKSSNGNSNIPQSNYVEISNVKVTTHWSVNWADTQQDGFYHDYPSDSSYSAYYRITGVVKNIADKPIDSATVTVNFYDDKGNYLDTTSAYVSALYLGESQTFTADLYGTMSSYFKEVSDYKIVISNVQLHQ